MAEMSSLEAAVWAKRQSKKYTDSVALHGVPVNYPKIVNGAWQVFDPAANEYRDTGAVAAGRDGHTPYIQDGYWHIDNVSTGIKAAGADGREVRLQATPEYIQWKYDGGAAWHNLMPLSPLKGNDGREILLRSAGNVLEWRYEGDAAWVKLFDFSAGGSAPAAAYRQGFPYQPDYLVYSGDRLARTVTDFTSDNTEPNIEDSFNKDIESNNIKIINEAAVMLHEI